RKRGYPMGDMTATMLSSATHALMDRNIDYANRPEPPVSDPDLYGLGALYRLYEASDGWIFLAAPQDSEWNTLVEALKPYTDLAQQKFSTPDLRRTHATDLAESLDAVLRTRSKFEWEK